jgi:hypothetical protein
MVQRIPAHSEPDAHTESEAEVACALPCPLSKAGRLTEIAFVDDANIGREISAELGNDVMPVTVDEFRSASSSVSCGGEAARRHNLQESLQRGSPPRPGRWAYHCHLLYSSRAITRAR